MFCAIASHTSMDILSRTVYKWADFYNLSIRKVLINSSIRCIIENIRHIFFVLFLRLFAHTISPKKPLFSLNLTILAKIACFCHTKIGTGVGFGVCSGVGFFRISR